MLIGNITAHDMGIFWTILDLTSDLIVQQYMLSQSGVVSLYFVQSISIFLKFDGKFVLVKLTFEADSTRLHRSMYII